MDVKTAIEETKAGKVEYRVDKTGVIHSPVGKVSFDGVTGKVAFDQYGDTTSKVLTVYKVAGGKWATVETKDFESK